MAWLIHSSGPWKDHKYKERTGTPGNYSYKYGNEEGGDDTKKYIQTSNMSGDIKDYGEHPHQTVHTYTGGNKYNTKRDTYVGERERYKKSGSREAVQDTYYADRTGYQRTNNARHDLVGDDNEAKQKHTKYNNRLKDFEKMSLTSMRNALNSAKENKKKSDADMRDAAVARGREQYMTNRAKKSVGAMSKAIEKKREEEKRKAYEHSRLNRIMGR